MTCAKRKVTCTIYTSDGPFVGTNDCENPQSVCPRISGEDYTKCRTICHQNDGHAEIQAIAAAKAFGTDLRGAVATIRGHYYICEPCGAAMRDAGLFSVTLRL
jgi:deoxycytidylate deaminase